MSIKITEPTNESSKPQIGDFIVAENCIYVVTGIDDDGDAITRVVYSKTEKDEVGDINSWPGAAWADKDAYNGKILPKHSGYKIEITL